MNRPSSVRATCARMARAIPALASAAGRVAAGLVGRVTVEGSSMEPTLAPGDRLLLVPAVGLRLGEIVAVPDPRDPSRLLVKRVVSLDRHRRLVSIEGDNPEQSTDSRAFGPVRRRAVVGRAVYRYAPAARAGPVGGRR